MLLLCVSSLIFPLSFSQCELDIMFHLDKVHLMLEEIVMNGCIVETSNQNKLVAI
jgi:hypothetical protein